MTAATHVLPLVGAYYRPPAKAILAVLPLDAPLMLRPEPDNPGDANAVAVLVSTSTIPDTLHNDLADAARPFGYDLEAILAAPQWHLGYIPAVAAAHIQPLLISAIDTAEPGVCWPATLQFAADGKPAVKFDLPSTWEHTDHAQYRK